MDLRENIIEELKEFFCIEELVDKVTFKRDGERAWRYFHTDLLRVLLFIRFNIDKSMTINDWKWGGRFSQRGLRTNICSIVKGKTLKGKLYLSAHSLGMGLDFDVKGMTADEVRDWIQSVEDSLPRKIRLEHKFAKSGKTITWVHIDVFFENKNPKVYLFNV